MILLKDNNDVTGFLVVGEGLGYYKLPKNAKAVIMKINVEYELDWINSIGEYNSKIHTTVQVNRLEYIVTGEMTKRVESPSIH